MHPPGATGGSHEPVARDAFSPVMGEGRGSRRRDQPPTRDPWWRWLAPHHPRLSEWLDRLAATGYVELEVSAGAHQNQYMLQASRRAGHAGHAVFDADAAAVLWLVDDWPDELITARTETTVRGWLLER